jgi:hypothetical protein
LAGNVVEEVTARREWDAPHRTINIGGIAKENKKCNVQLTCGKTVEDELESLS